MKTKGSRSSKKTTLALYGNVALPRTYCSSCESSTFVFGGIKQCCDTAASGGPVGVQRMSEPVQKRRRLGAQKQAEILKEQGYRCLYCERTFDSSVWVEGKQKVLRLVWDHSLPYAYSQNNESSNFVAACHICNGWKSDHIFQTLEETKVYLATKWQSATAVPRG